MLRFGNRARPLNIPCWLTFSVIFLVSCANQQSSSPNQSAPKHQASANLFQRLAYQESNIHIIQLDADALRASTSYQLSISKCNAAPLNASERLASYALDNYLHQKGFVRAQQGQAADMAIELTLNQGAHNKETSKCTSHSIDTAPLPPETSPNQQVFQVQLSLNIEHKLTGKTLFKAHFDGSPNVNTGGGFVFYPLKALVKHLPQPESSSDTGSDSLGFAIDVLNIAENALYPVITQVSADSIASKSGLRFGDYITAIDNASVNGLDAAQYLEHLTRLQHHGGQLSVVRNQHTISLYLPAVSSQRGQH